MKNQTSFLFALLVFFTAVFFLKQTHRFERIAYESFLRYQGLAAPDRPEKRGESDVPADNPDVAAFQDYLMTLDPSTGTVPRERLLAACQKTDALNRMKSGDNEPVWQNYPAEMGGRTRALMFDPNDGTHKKVWAGGVTGGLWYNNDITGLLSSWVPVGDFWPCLAIRCITYDPNNTSVFYIGTGEPETAIQTYRESSGVGDGIWKSTDGGITWNQLASTTGFAYVPKIVVRNENGASVLYAAVVSGLYHGTTHPSQPSEGLFRSADGGVTWQQVLPTITGLSISYSPSDVVLGADGRIYVGTMPNVEGNGAATILFSDTGLPGSWTKNETYKTEIENDPQYSIPGRVVIGCSQSDPTVVYALIGSGFINPDNNFKYFYCFHILRSADKGVTWTKKNLPSDLTSGISFATIAWHALDIAVDPTNKDVVFIGGLDVHKTSNGGTSWTRLSDWSAMYSGGGPDYLHADQHIMVYRPTFPTYLLFGTDGGVFLSANANAAIPTFSPRNMDYNTLQFYSCDLKNEVAAEEFVGGLQDNGSLWYHGFPLNITDMLSGGDGAFCFYDKDDPDFCLTSVYYNQYYLWNNGSWYNQLDFWYSGVFVNPTDYDYRENTLYANACDFVGNNVDQILRISNVYGSPNGNFVSLNTGSQVYFSAVKWSQHSPSGKATLFVGTQSGRLFKIQNAQATPVKTEITGTNFPAASISCVDVGGSEDTLLVTFSNYGVTSVFKSFNGGQSWEDAEGNLPDMPIRWCLFHPSDSKHVMLATETGVWMTSNLLSSSVTWSPVNISMGNVRVDMLKMRESDMTVLAATHGRGLFTCTWDVETGIPWRPELTMTVHPNPVHDRVVIDFGKPVMESLQLRISDAGGRIVRQEDLPAGTSELQRDLSGLSPGVYFLGVFHGGKSIVVRKLIKQ